MQRDCDSRRRCPVRNVERSREYVVDDGPAEGRLPQNLQGQLREGRRIRDECQLGANDQGQRGSDDPSQRSRRGNVEHVVLVLGKCLEGGDGAGDSRDEGGNKDRYRELDVLGDGGQPMGEFVDQLESHEAVKEGHREVRQVRQIGLQVGLEELEVGIDPAGDLVVEQKGVNGEVPRGGQSQDGGQDQPQRVGIPNQGGSGDEEDGFLVGKDLQVGALQQAVHAGQRVYGFARQGNVFEGPVLGRVEDRELVPEVGP
mmetsp:Transcript_9164/g.22282  ORF Transcript_9164/g.22282 Transcript_9164/m.22282 type:complete len:257 (-) Transcript_9164:1955-2725(-)